MASTFWRDKPLWQATWLALLLLSALLLTLPFISSKDNIGAGSTFLDNWATPIPTKGLSGAVLGKALAQYYCISCHEPTSPYSGKSIAPGFRGFYESTVTLDDGARVQVDEAYLRSAIITPWKETPAGYVPGSMHIAKKLTDAQVDALVAYIESLR